MLRKGCLVHYTVAINCARSSGVLLTASANYAIDQIGARYSP